MDRKTKLLIQNLMLVICIVLYSFTLSRTFEYQIEKALLSNLIFGKRRAVNVMTPLSQAYNFDTSISSNLSISEDNFLTGSSNFSFSDPRVVAMRSFLIDYGSPMYPYADAFVYYADEHSLDWRMVASISGVETAFGNLAPVGSNNAWGWRGGPGGTFTKWQSWRTGIETVTQGLAQGYGTNLTPYDIESTYCPPCGATGDHVWANGVSSYMIELDYYLDNLGN
ncbi:hypothetical protein GF357_01665 [Candidatus Dojkabacteria bacterium]|nr:hypothetical protein [Candidatus Dojkabacteria bacterium]